VLRADVSATSASARKRMNGATVRCGGRLGASLFLPGDMVLGASARPRGVRYDAAGPERPSPATRDGGPERKCTLTLNVSLLAASLDIAGFTPQLALTREVASTNAAPVEPRTRLDLRLMQQF
jgi:hypothetical protein